MLKLIPFLLVLDFHLLFSLIYIIHKSNEQKFCWSSSTKSESKSYNPILWIKFLLWHSFQSEDRKEDMEALCQPSHTLTDLGICLHLYLFCSGHVPSLFFPLVVWISELHQCPCWRKCLRKDGWQNSTSSNRSTSFNELVVKDRYLLVTLYRKTSDRTWRGINSDWVLIS